jgi:hypothetical protein
MDNGFGVVVGKGDQDGRLQPMVKKCNFFDFKPLQQCEPFHAIPMRLIQIPHGVYILGSATLQKN